MNTTYQGNFGDLAQAPMRAFPERAAVIQSEVTLTYRQLDGRMNRVAGLLELGHQVLDRDLARGNGEVWSACTHRVLPRRQAGQFE